MYFTSRHRAAHVRELPVGQAQTRGGTEGDDGIPPPDSRLPLTDRATGLRACGGAPLGLDDAGVHSDGGQDGRGGIDVHRRRAIRRP